jgi:hypothetical protein
VKSLEKTDHDLWKLKCRLCLDIVLLFTFLYKAILNNDNGNLIFVYDRAIYPMYPTHFKQVTTYFTAPCGKVHSGENETS